jgi:hypothetical protein
MKQPDDVCEVSFRLRLPLVALLRLVVAWWRRGHP